MLPKIGFSLEKQYDLPITQVISLLKKAGFSAVSPVWTPELDLPALAASVKAQGMTIQSLHAPHKGVPLLWEPDSPLAAAPQKAMLQCIDDCARFHIPILVVHGWQGLIYTFPDKTPDFRFFDTLVAHAKSCGVSVAFENLEGEEYLQALMSRYRNQGHVGFCWDSGHDHCYPHRLDFLKEFGDRLIMTHLNDNLGTRSPKGTAAAEDDLHFLPYDGNLDWDFALNRLKTLPKQTTLNFELKISSHSKDARDLLYAHTPLEQFIAEAGKRAQRIARKYAAIVSIT